MKIVGKVEVQGYLRIGDLNDGEVFCFCDDNEVYIKARQGYIVNLKNGYMIDYECEDYELYADRPVRILKAHLAIE